MAQADRVHTIDADASVLIVTDIQSDFLPGGALAVGGGDEIITPVDRLMRSERFGLYIATQDWHPPDHISFVRNHPGHRLYDNISLYGHEQTLWPDHCVQGSPGAELYAGLPWNVVSAVVRKGNRRGVDSYSTFRNNWDEHGRRPPTGLGGYLRERGIRDVYICGLARDFCVKWSAEDAADAGFNVYFIWDATRPVWPESDPQVRRDLAVKNIEIVDTTILLGA